MPQYKITTPEGTFNIWAPEGASMDEVLLYAKQHAPPKAGPLNTAPVVKMQTPRETPQSWFERTITPWVTKKMAETGATLAPPGADVRSIPQPEEIALKNLKEKYPDLAGMAATTVAGGPLGRMAAGGAVSALGNLLQGKAPDEALSKGATFAATQGAGEGLMRVGTLAATPLLKRVFEGKTATAVADYLKATVPAFKEFPSDAKGLYRMLYSQEGYDALHKMADDSFKGVIQRGASQTITIPKDVALKFKIPIIDDAIQQSGANRVGQGDPVQSIVNAADAARATIGKWRTNPGEYGLVMGALDEAGVGDPAGRMAYKTAIGAGNYFDKTGALQGERYDAGRAMSGLGVFGQAGELLKRGLGRGPSNFMDIIRGPEPVPIEATNQNPWTRKLYGALAGEAAATVLGLPRGVGGLGGAVAGEALLPRASGVPIPQALKDTTPVLATGLGEAFRELTGD